MRNLLVYGFEKAGEQVDTQTFFDLAVTHFRDFYGLRISVIIVVNM